MKKTASVMFALLFAVVLGLSAQGAQKKFSAYAVGFYNLENLFDTSHDEGKRDFEFLPTGTNKWNGLKYSHKLRNMARVLAEMGTDKLPGVGCAVIGVSEVENAKALTDLCEQAPLKERNMQFVHIEGPDKRGVDCAMLYNPALFTVKNAVLVPYISELEKDSGYCTRGFLTISGEMAGEHVAVIVNHWPSRFAGSFYREQAGRMVRAVKDSLIADDPDVKIFIMGDMNDDPTDKSMKEELGAIGDIKKLKKDNLYNPWYNVFTKEGTGTLTYQGSWNLFDQIVVTPNLVNKNGGKDFSDLKLWKHQIFRRDYMFQTEGKYKGNPKRTHAGGAWLDGYSDHLPVILYLLKEQK